MSHIWYTTSTHHFLMPPWQFVIFFWWLIAYTCGPYKHVRNATDIYWRAYTLKSDRGVLSRQAPDAWAVPDHWDIIWCVRIRPPVSAHVPNSRWFGGKKENHLNSWIRMEIWTTSKLKRVFNIVVSLRSPQLWAKLPHVCWPDSVAWRKCSTSVFALLFLLLQWSWHSGLSVKTLFSLVSQEEQVDLHPSIRLASMWGLGEHIYYTCLSVSGGKEMLFVQLCSFCLIKDFICKVELGLSS